MRPFKCSWRVCYERQLCIAMALFSTRIQLLAYAVDIIGRTVRDATAAFSAIKRESAKMGLEVNDELCRVGSQIAANSYNFNVVKEFR